MLANPMEMEATKTRSIFEITKAVLTARQSDDKETENAAVLEFIDHILTHKERDSANLNECGRKVFPYPLKWQKFSPSCQDCTNAAFTKLKNWRNDYLPKSEVLIGELWGFQAGQILLDPIDTKATIKGFTQDRKTVVLDQQGKDVRLTKAELGTYKLYIPQTATEPSKKEAAATQEKPETKEAESKPATTAKPAKKAKAEQEKEAVKP